MQPTSSQPPSEALALRNAHRDAVASSRRSRVRKAEAPPAASCVLVYVPGEPVHYECSAELNEREALEAILSRIQERLRELT